jgi:hypothetical protein
MDQRRLKVIVGLYGGLGNQMFQYAMGRAVSLRLSAQLELDISSFSGVPDRQFALKPFSIQADILPAKDNGVGHGSVRQKIYQKLARRFSGRRLGVKVFRERTFHFDPASSGIEESVYLDGYWQSEKYFSSVPDAIAEDFSLRHSMTVQSNEMLNKISGSNAICLHVRRGDYVSNPSANAVHGLCSLDYYQAGLKYVCSGVSDPHCFVFSDDPEWVRANLHLPFSMTIVDFNGPDMAHEDLHLMAACKHFVIANSSLSWWGAWMGKHPGKRVVAPKQWFRNDSKDTSDLIPATWIRL